MPPYVAQNMTSAFGTELVQPPVMPQHAIDEVEAEENGPSNIIMN